MKCMGLNICMARKYIRQYGLCARIHVILKIVHISLRLFPFLTPSVGPLHLHTITYSTHMYMRKHQNSHAAQTHTNSPFPFALPQSHKKRHTPIVTLPVSRAHTRSPISSGRTWASDLGDEGGGGGDDTSNMSTDEGGGERNEKWDLTLIDSSFSACG